MTTHQTEGDLWSNIVRTMIRETGNESSHFPYCNESVFSNRKFSVFLGDDKLLKNWQLLHYGCDSYAQLCKKRGEYNGLSRASKVCAEMKDIYSFCILSKPCQFGEWYFHIWLSYLSRCMAVTIWHVSACTCCWKCSIFYQTEFMCSTWFQSC